MLRIKVTPDYIAKAFRAVDHDVDASEKAPNGTLNLQEFIAAYQLIYSGAKLDDDLQDQLDQKEGFVRATRYGYTHDGTYLFECYTLPSDGKPQKYTVGGMPRRGYSRTQFDKHALNRQLRQAQVEDWHGTIDDIGSMMKRDSQQNGQSNAHIRWWVDAAYKHVNRAVAEELVAKFGLPNNSKFLSSFGSFGNALGSDPKTRIMVGTGSAPQGAVSSVTFFAQTMYVMQRPLVHHLPAWLCSSSNSTSAGVGAGAGADASTSGGAGSILQSYLIKLWPSLDYYYKSRFAWMFNLSWMNNTTAEELTSAYDRASAIADIIKDGGEEWEMNIDDDDADSDDDGAGGYHAFGGGAMSIIPSISMGEIIEEEDVDGDLSSVLPSKTAIVNSSEDNEEIKRKDQDKDIDVEKEQDRGGKQQKALSNSHDSDNVLTTQRTNSMSAERDVINERYMDAEKNCADAATNANIKNDSQTKSTSRTGGIADPGVPSSAKYLDCENTIFSTSGRSFPSQKSEQRYDRPPAWLLSNSKLYANPPRTSVDTISCHILDQGCGAHTLLTVRQIDDEGGCLPGSDALTCEQRSRSGVLGRIVSGLWVRLAEVIMMGGSADVTGELADDPASLVTLLLLMVHSFSAESSTVLDEWLKLLEKEIKDMVVSKHSAHVVEAERMTKEFLAYVDPLEALLQDFLQQQQTRLQTQLEDIQSDMDAVNNGEGGGGGGGELDVEEFSLGGESLGAAGGFGLSFRGGRNSNFSPSSKKLHPFPRGNSGADMRQFADMYSANIEKVAVTFGVVEHFLGRDPYRELHTTLDGYELLDVKGVISWKDRLNRYLNTAESLKGLINSQMDEKRNFMSFVLTIVTTVLAPLAIVTAYFGMNFDNMSEFDSDTYKWFPGVWLMWLITFVSYGSLLLIGVHFRVLYSAT